MIRAAQRLTKTDAEQLIASIGGKHETINEQIAAMHRCTAAALTKLAGPLGWPALAERAAAAAGLDPDQASALAAAPSAAAGVEPRVDLDAAYDALCAVIVYLSECRRL